MHRNQLQEDIHYLFATLEQKHVDIYKLISKEKYQEIKNQLEQNLPEEISKEDFEIYLMQLFSEIKDPHTQVALTIKRMPITFEWVNGNYYPIVIPVDMENLLGIKLVKIDGIPLEKFIETALKYTVVDNAEIEKVAIADIFHNFSLIKYITKNQNNFVTYEFENGKNAKLNCIKDTPNLQQISLTRKVGAFDFLVGRTNYALQTFDDLLYIRYTSCRADSKYPLEDFTKDILKKLEAKPNKIVIDLRNNGGGNSSLFDPIIDLLKEHINNHPANVYCFINRRVFSSGVLHTIRIKKVLNATLVGQPTSQGFNHYGDFSIFRLPNSNIEIQYSTKRFGSEKENDKNVFPDILIEPTMERYLAGKDMVLDCAINAKEINPLKSAILESF